MGLLLALSRLEVDVYAAPRRLPAGAYKRAVAAAAAAETGLAPLLRYLTRASRPLDRSLAHTLAPQLRALQAALVSCCEALASAVEGQPFAGALAALADLEAARDALNRAAASAATPSAEAAIAFSVLRGNMYLVASKVRCVACGGGWLQRSGAIVRCASLQL